MLQATAIMRAHYQLCTFRGICLPENREIDLDYAGEKGLFLRDRKTLRTNIWNLIMFSC